MQTSYIVVESDGKVGVCVNLTHPESNIFEETVLVESHNDPTSFYIPPDAVLASKLHVPLHSYSLSLLTSFHFPQLLTLLEDTLWPEAPALKNSYLIIIA